MTNSARQTRTVPTVQPLDGEPPEDDDSQACGWFESSWALREGLAVLELGAGELPDPDGTLAALWFAALATPGATASDPWQ